MNRLKVAIQGIDGSFHDQAARQYFGENIETVECMTFRECCRLAVDRQVDYALMAIENSIAGSILSNYALIREYDLTISGEIYCKIEQHLLGQDGVDLSEIRFIKSHPMAILQCQDFLNANQDFQVIETPDTALCAKEIIEHDLRNTAAIAGEFAAEKYKLQILQRNIESESRNYTRFLVLSPRKEAIAKPDKASLCFQLKHQTGTLADVLSYFKKWQINLLKIQSLPILSKPTEYTFYVDVEWGDYQKYQISLVEIATLSSSLQILGEYKKAELFMIP